MIEVLRCRPGTLVQDLGRPGLSGLGVSRSGAADRASFALANRLVGNAPHAAALEVTLGGLALRFDVSATIAVTGARTRVTAHGSHGAGMNCPFAVAAGCTVELSSPARGLRTYVAVRGGFEATPVLGSRATDVLSGVGPPQVAPSDRFEIGSCRAGWPTADLAPVADPPHSPVLEVIMVGNSPARLPAPASGLIGHYIVGDNSNRTALRLIGPRLTHWASRRAEPQGLVVGAVQIPPNGQPVVFLADHPVTGGYPVIGALTRRSINAAAQMRPGDTVQLRASTGQGGLAPTHAV